MTPPPQPPSSLPGDCLIRLGIRKKENTSGDMYELKDILDTNICDTTSRKDVPDSIFKNTISLDSEPPILLSERNRKKVSLCLKKVGCNY